MREYQYVEGCYYTYTEYTGRYDTAIKANKKSRRGLSVLSLLPRPPNCLHQVALGNTLPARIVPSCDLRVDLDTAVGRDEVLGNIVSIVDRDARVDDGVVFPVEKYEHEPAMHEERREEGGGAADAYEREMDDEREVVDRVRQQEMGVLTCRSSKPCCRSS